MGQVRANSPEATKSMLRFETLYVNETIHVQSHCYFIILNHRKKGPVYFCHSALLGIHGTLEQIYFLKSRKGFLR